MSALFAGVSSLNSKDLMRLLRRVSEVMQVKRVWHRDLDSIFISIPGSFCRTDFPQVSKEANVNSNSAAPHSSEQ